MIERIRIYVNQLFADAPQTKKAIDLRDEMCSNLIDKYVDLTGRGISEEEAYKTAISGIGDIDEMMRILRQDYEFEDPQARRRNALLVSLAVSLYIISVVPLFLSDALGYNPVIGLVALFMLCAAATGLLIYNALTRPRYNRMDDTMVEEFKEWKRQREESKNGVYGALSGALWMTIVAVYFVISFMLNIWHISWIVFLVGAAIQQIIRAATELNK